MSNWSNTINILSTLWILMAWCFSTRAAVATMLRTQPCFSSCLRVDTKYLIATDKWTLKKKPHKTFITLNHYISTGLALEEANNFTKLVSLMNIIQQFLATCVIPMSSILLTSYPWSISSLSLFLTQHKYRPRRHLQNGCLVILP